MKNILALNGGMRTNGNSTVLMQNFLNGAKTNSEFIEEIIVKNRNIDYCTGCLRCNILGKCSLRNDEWNSISEKILNSDVLVFSSPVYFHHVTAPLKKLIDRFRSFIHVQLTETGLIHTPRVQWKKDFVLILSMGTSDLSDAKPIIDLFRFMIEILGIENKLHVFIATKMVNTNQIIKSEVEIAQLYEKLKLPVYLAKEDHIKNQNLLNEVFELGEKLSR